MHATLNLSTIYTYMWRKLRSNGKRVEDNDDIIDTLTHKLVLLESLKAF